MAERYHFYDCVHHVQIKPYVIWKKQPLFYKEIYINTEHKVQRKWVGKIWLGKILETRWKKSVVVENVSLITDLKSCLTSLTQKRFQESWENTKKSSLQKIYICNLSSNADLDSRSSYCLSSLFYSHDRQAEETRGREDIIKKGVDRSKTKPWTKTNYNEIHKKSSQRICRA